MFQTPNPIDIPTVNANGGQSGATQRGNDAVSGWHRKNPIPASRAAAFRGLLDRLEARADAAFEATQRGHEAKLEAGAAIGFHDEHVRTHGETPEGAERRKALVAEREEEAKLQESRQAASKAANSERGALRTAYNSMTVMANALALSDTKPRLATTKLPHGSPVDVLAKAIARRADLLAERKGTEGAVGDKESATRTIIDQCMRLADEGRAGLRVTLGGRRGPTLHLPVEVVAAEPTGDTVPVATDAGALIAALFPEKFEKAALAALDVAYATKGLIALNPIEKAKKISSIEADILAQDRIIADATLAAHAQHFDVTVPADLAAKAMLGIE